MAKPCEIAVFLLAALVWPDTLILDYSGPQPAEFQWNVAGGVPLSVVNDQDFEGGIAFKLANSRPTSNRAPRWCSNRLPYRKSFWLRYHFKLVNGDFPGKDSKTSDQTNLFVLSFSEVREPRQPTPDILFRIHNQGGGRDRILECQIRPSINDETFRISRLSFDEATLGCFEAKVDFPSKDTLSFEWFLNGKSAGNFRTPYFFTAEFIEFGLAHPGIGDGKWDLVFGDFRVGPRRHFTRLSPALNRHESVRGDSVILYASDWKSGYEGENAVVIRWLLRSAERVILDQSIRDPLFFDSLPVPFPLDKGDYGWKVRALNNFGLWGPWSDERRFGVVSERRLAQRILDTWITSDKESRPQRRLDTIRPGNSYRLHIKLRPVTGWDRLAYIIAQLHHSDFTQGNPMNRGGNFIPDSNYVVNISFGPKFPLSLGEVKLLEKSPGSNDRRNIKPGEKGTYLDLEKGKLLLDTSQGTMSFPILLSDSIECGSWLLSVYARDTDERLSNTYTRNMMALSESRGGLFRFWWAVIVLSVIGLGIFIRQRISATGQFQETRDMGRIRQYIMDHIQEEMSFDSIRKDLRLSIHRFHKILAENNSSSVPKLINQIRIQKAQFLLKQSEKPISEIGFEVGFVDASYFTRIFREITGKTPTEYRSTL